MVDAGLTNEEMSAVVWDQFAFWHYRQASYLDELTVGERTEFDGGIRNSYGLDVVGRQWYDGSKPMLNPDFVRCIDNLLAQPV